MARREFDAEAPYHALSFTLERSPALIPASGRILLLHPRAHAALGALPPARSDVITPEQLDCVRLAQRGYSVLSGPEAAAPGYSLCVVFPGESKDEALRLLGLGATLAAPEAIVLAAMSNDLGASRYASKLEELLGSVESQSKCKCRVFWGAAGSADPAKTSQWIAGGEPRLIEDAGFWSVPGLFSWNKIDKGSAALAAILPGSIRGRGADLGCGYGFLAKAALERCPGIESLTLFDSDRRALDMAKRNLEGRGGVSFEWRDIQSKMPEGRFDFVIMNPPFHEYGRLNVELGKRFFRSAHGIMRPGGSLYAVVNRHLPYDETLWGIFPTLTELSNAEGYRVLHTVK